jgi:hypothetical protein
MIRAVLFLAALLCAAPILPARAGTLLPLKNPGFEKSLLDWTAQEKARAMISAAPEAAHTGKRGLRINDRSSKLGVVLLSSPTFLDIRRIHRVTFWARTQAGGVAEVRLHFLGADYQMITTSTRASRQIDNADGTWRPYAFIVNPPVNAFQFVLMILSYPETQGVVDIDDISVEEMEAE